MLAGGVNFMEDEPLSELRWLKYLRQVSNSLSAQSV